MNFLRPNNLFIPALFMALFMFAVYQVERLRDWLDVAMGDYSDILLQNTGELTFVLVIIAILFKTLNVGTGKIELSNQREIENDLVVELCLAALVLFVAQSVITF